MAPSGTPVPYSRIEATGSALPANVIANPEIEQRCGLDPGWIEQRTGIRTRHVVSPDQAVSDLAIEAGQQALLAWKKRCPSTAMPGMLILATSTPDHLLPPTAPLVAHRLKLGTIPALDIAVACSGFLYALQLADGYCRTRNEAVLIIAANVLSKRVAADDPATAALFGDGAGAVIVGPATTPGLRAIQLSSDGSGYEALQIPDGGSRQPFTSSSFQDQAHLMRVHNGMAVFRYAVESMAQLGQQVLDEAGVAVEELDLWIPHQANLRIIESARQRLGVDPSRTAVTIDRLANSSAATIPLTLDEWVRQNRVDRGDKILLTAAAAGLTSGAALLEF